MLRRIAVGLTLGLVVVAALVLPAGTAAPAEADGARPPLTTPEGFANAEFEIRVYANGSARWAIRASRPLENNTQIELFRSFARRFESTETSAFRNFKVRARRLVAFGTSVTGREMNATGFARDARVVELGQTRGVVELSFMWTNFARTDGRRVVVADVFEGGMFVDSGQRLIISHGPQLAFQSVDPPPDAQSVEDNLTASETVTWLGERDFTDNRPRAVFVPPELAGGDETPTPSPAATGTDGTDTGGTDTGGTDTGGDTTRGLGMLPFVVAVVVLLGLGGGFALYSGAIGELRPGGGGGAGGAGAASTGPVPEEELLSDEDRVLQLLEENGGRMRQVDIVTETDWSKSKVSMLLSDMEEDGEISKLRLGRENIISKAGEEPDAAGSPFEGE